MRRTRPAPKAPRPQTVGRDGSTEERILAAAHVVFVRAGTAGARMQEIAKEARVNPALLHYYFRSKAKLAEAVFLRTASQLFPAVLQVMASALPLEEKVARVIEIEFDHLTHAPYLPTFVLSELAHHPERLRQFVTTFAGRPPAEAARQMFDTLGRQIAERIREGAMHPIDPEQFLVNLISLCVFPFAAKPMLMVLFDSDEARFERFLGSRRRTLGAFILRGLRA